MINTTKGWNYLKAKPYKLIILSNYLTGACQIGIIVNYKNTTTMVAKISNLQVIFHSMEQHNVLVTDYLTDALVKRYRPTGVS